MRRISPRELKRLSRKLGIDIKELSGVVEVRIVLEDKELVFENPIVNVLSVGKEKIFQVMGEYREEERKVEGEEEIEISDEDIELVALQAGVSREEAKRALIEAKGDLAKAIILLTSQKR